MTAPEEGAPPGVAQRDRRTYAEPISTLLSQSFAQRGEPIFANMGFITSRKILLGFNTMARVQISPRYDQVGNTGRINFIRVYQGQEAKQHRAGAVLVIDPADGDLLAAGGGKEHLCGSGPLYVSRTSH